MVVVEVTVVARGGSLLEPLTQKFPHLTLSLRDRSLLPTLLRPNVSEKHADLRIIAEVRLGQDNLAILRLDGNWFGKLRPNLSLKRLGGSLQDGGETFVLPQVGKIGIILDVGDVAKTQLHRQLK